MKRFVFATLLVMMTFCSGSIGLAAESAPLGMGNIALKVDYFSFSDDDLDDLDLADGLYLGLEGYGHVANNIYFGAESGYFNEDKSGSFSDGFTTIAGDIELTYVPVELNVKYAVAVNPNFVFDVGGGVSYNYTELEISGSVSNPDIGIISGSFSEDDWLFGGQFFADVNFTFDTFFFGVNGKYQIVEEFDEFDVSADNWRIGGQAGFKF